MPLIGVVAPANDRETTFDPPYPYSPKDTSPTIANDIAQSL